MPTHEWKCNKCETVTPVLRKLGKHSEKPTPKEAKCDCGADFTKTIGKPPSASFGAAWAGGGGGKGKW